MKLLAAVLTFVIFGSSISIDKYRITSEILGYDLQYWVNVPSGYEDTPLPVLFVTDGKWYKEQGEIIEISRKLIASGEVKPHIIVMVDAFDPTNSTKNRRNSQFLCNPDYVNFYKRELIPKIEKDFSTITSQSGRGILGLSFGGLNSMYFALNASDTFRKVGIQSPAPHPCPTIFKDFDAAGKLPIDIFLNTGTVNDKAKDTRRLKSILDKNGYDYSYLEVPEGHNWKNWKPMLDDVLMYFYGKP